MTTDKFSKLKIVFILFMTIVFMSGCSENKFELSTLTRPPIPLGEVGKVQTAIEDIFGKDVQFKYPESGEYRSAIALHDVDLDGEKEAFAVCKINSGEQFLHLLVLKSNDDSYRLVKNFYVYGENVDKICFGDVDGDGQDELVIGWSNSVQLKSQISVYDYFDSDYREISINNDYTEIELIDIDDDNVQELFTVHSDVKENSTCVKLLKFNLESQEEEFDTISNVDMMFDIENIHIKCGMVDQHRKGAFIEGLTSSDYTVTGIVYWDNDQKKLVNPLTEKGIVWPLASREMEVYSSDINNDGIIEIPSMEPMVTSNKASGVCVPYKLDWVQFDMDNMTLSPVKSIICNYSEKYCFDLPEVWRTKGLYSIYVTINDRDRTMSFSENIVDENNLQAAGVDLFTIKVYSEKEWNQSSKSEIEIFNDDTYVYVLTQINLDHELSVTKEEIMDSFQRIKNL